MQNDPIRGVALVRFNVEEVAECMGIDPHALAVAMFEACASHLVRDAWSLLELTMHERGLRAGVDPYPDGWPTDFLATVAAERMFSDPQDEGPHATHGPGHA
jgi:hypothetical protein